MTGRRSFLALDIDGFGLQQVGGDAAAFELLGEGQQQGFLTSSADGIRTALGVGARSEGRADHDHPPPAVAHQVGDESLAA